MDTYVYAALSVSMGLVLLATQLQVQELATSLESERKARQEAATNSNILQERLRFVQCPFFLLSMRRDVRQ